MSKCLNVSMSQCLNAYISTSTCNIFQYSYKTIQLHIVKHSSCFVFSYTSTCCTFSKSFFWRILNVALHVAPDYATQSTSWFILPPLRATEFDEVASYCGPRALPGCRPFLFEGPQLLLPDRTFLRHIFPWNILGILPRSPVRFFRLFDNMGIWRQH